MTNEPHTILYLVGGLQREGTKWLNQAPKLLRRLSLLTTTDSLLGPIQKFSTITIATNAAQEELCSLIENIPYFILFTTNAALT